MLERPPATLHARWISAVLGEAPPTEPRATCDRCAMLPAAGPAAGAAPEGGPYFSATTRCCTYLPAIANFLVGAALDDPATDPRGRASLRARMAARRAVSPLGLETTGTYHRLYAQGGFGLSEALRCPHYVEESGHCGIWRHREATCTTWFCKHERGAAGATFWSSMRSLLTTLERAVAIHCLVATDVGDDALAMAIDDQSSNPPRRTEEPSDADHARRFGQWAGREEALYVRCAEIAGALSCGDVMQLGGAGASAAAAVVRSRFNALASNELPRALRAAQFEVLPLDRLNRRVRSYRPSDTIEVPAAVLDALHRFDGGPTVEVVERIEREDGVPLDRALMRRLIDFELLVPEA